MLGLVLIITSCYLLQTKTRSKKMRMQYTNCTQSSQGADC